MGLKDGMRGYCVPVCATTKSIQIMATTEAIQNPFKVGDILHHQWVYTMSFPEFFRVESVSPKSVVVIELGKRMHDNYDGYGQAGTEVPDESVTCGKPRRCVLRSRCNGQIGALVDKGCIALKWDGKPKQFYGD